MKAILTALLAVAVLACLGAMRDPTDQDIMTLRKQLADVGLRVSRLEQAAGAAPGPADPEEHQSTDGDIARSIVVTGIDEGKVLPLDQDDVDDLNRDARALQKTSMFHQDQSDRVAGNTYYVGGRYSQGHYGYDHSNSGRNHMEMAQDRMASRYATVAANKREQAAAMTAHANQPQQIITGHDGDVLFVLKTKHDLSFKLKNISIGDTVTWTGTRESADHDSESWDITTIRKIERE